MRDQFVGDISDLRKFAFLRAIIPPGSRLGVAWYYNSEHDGTASGKHREHINEQKWALLDPVVHGALSQFEVHTVAALEQLPIWPESTIFHREPMPSGLRRSLWARQMRDVLAPADLVFVDPDNGLGPATTLHATVDEIDTLALNGRPVVLIRFPHRNAKYPDQLKELHGLFNDRAITTIMTSVWIRQPRAVWFSIVNSTDELDKAAVSFADAFDQIHHAKAEVHKSKSFS